MKRLLISTLWLALAGCNRAYDIAPSDASSGLSDAPRLDGGTLDGGGIADDGGDAPPDAPSSRDGMFLVAQQPGQTEVVTIFGAFDSEALLLDTLVGCSATIIGSCTVNECTDPRLPAGDANAGAISVSRGGTILVNTAPTGNSYTWSEPTALFAFTDALWVNAVGDGVPAWSTLVEWVPAPTFSIPVNLSRSAPAYAVWSGNTRDADLVGVHIVGSDTLSITCEAPGSAGMVEIPSAAVARLSASTVTIKARTRNVRHVVAGQYDVSVVFTEMATARRVDVDD